MIQINLSWYPEFEKIVRSHDIKSTQVEIKIHDKYFTELSYLLTKSVLLQYFLFILKILRKKFFFAVSVHVQVFQVCMIRVMFCVKLCVFILIKIEVVISVNFMFFFVFMIHVSESNYWFLSFTYSVEASYEEWSWWNFFIKMSVSFFIIIYDSHVLCLYSSHLIRSSNHANFIFYFMLLIKLTKYESSLFSIIISYDDSTYLLIELFFENHNRLMWNIEWTFISDDNLSSYI